MHRRNFSDGQEVVIADSNGITQAIERGLYDRLMYQTLQRVTDAFFGDSFETNYSSATSVIVRDGLGFQEDTSQTNPEPEKRPLLNYSDQVKNITTPDAINDRIDIVVVKNEVVDDLSESRKFKAAIGGAATTQAMDVQYKWEAEILVVAGTPAGVPVAPATPAGYLKIATLDVTAVTGLSGAGAVTDNRTKFPVGGDIFLDTSGLIALTAGAGTTLDTLMADIDALLVSAIYDVSIKSTDYIVLDNDQIRTLIINDTTATRTITLPTAADNANRIISIINTSTQGNPVVLDGEGGEFINGKTTWNLPDRWDCMTLQCDGTGWIILSSSGEHEAGSVVVKSGDYVVLDGDGFDTILVDDTSTDRTVTLPTAADNKHREILVKNTSTDGGKVTVDGEGAETIDGNLTMDIYLQDDDLMVICDGSNWQVKHEYPVQLINDWTVIGNVGDVDQMMAGHYWDTDESGAGTDVAYYKFLAAGMTDDEEGTYNLTDPGGANSPTNANGIFGADYAAYFDGGDYYTQATLLDAPSGLSNGLAIDFWFKADDGQPGAAQYFCCKYNDEGAGTLDYFELYLHTDGRIRFNVVANAAAVTPLISSTILPNGVTGFYYVCACWNSINGAELYINKTRESATSSETTLLGDGVTRDFIVGANNFGGAIAGQFTGYMSMLRIRDIVLTEKDAHLGHASRIVTPSIYNANDFDVQARLQKDGDADFARQIQLQEVARNSSYIYPVGNQFGSTDKIRLLSK